MNTWNESSPSNHSKCWEQTIVEHRRHLSTNKGAKVKQGTGVKRIKTPWHMDPWNCMSEHITREAISSLVIIINYSKLPVQPSFWLDQHWSLPRSQAEKRRHAVRRYELWGTWLCPWWDRESLSSSYGSCQPPAHPWERVCLRFSSDCRYANMGLGKRCVLAHGSTCFHQGGNSPGWVMFILPFLALIAHPPKLIFN